MPKEHRKLAALMFTDIVGYTALAQRDESLALELLAEHNALFRKAFSEHAGQEIKCTGDGFLVEFESPVQSVRCALEIQASCAQRNAEVDDSRRFQVRIGIHLGDIVHEAGDVFGDGVNVASRVEPLAEGGGICITRQVHDHVWNKIPAAFTSLGLRDLKNLRAPIEVFEVTPFTSDQRIAAVGQDRTRIAVLPLVNISPDASDAYFADGMTEELIYTLSKVGNLHVIAQTSSMSYKDSNKSVADIGRELRIGSVLEGSVRKAGNSLRITVQLINVSNQEHVWSERYDRELEDVFSIQSDIAQCVAQALEVRLLATEKRGIETKTTENVDAYALYLKGRYFLARRTVEDLAKAGHYFKEAVELDEGFAPAHAGLAEYFHTLPQYGVLDPRDALPQAREAAKKALSLDETVVSALLMLATLCLTQDRDPNSAERRYREAIKLHPGCAEAHGQYAFMLMALARPEEALRESKIALELDPVSLLLNRQLGNILYSARMYGEAMEAFQKTLELDPDFALAHMGLGLVFLARGRHEDAILEFKKEKGIPQSFMMPFIGLADVYAGRRSRGREIMKDALEEEKQEHVSLTSLAALCLSLGDDDVAFRLLEEAYEEKDAWLRYLLVSPLVDSVRGDSRLQSLLKREGLDIRPG
jgi:adenylate cyclase